MSTPYLNALARLHNQYEQERQILQRHGIHNPSPVLEQLTNTEQRMRAAIHELEEALEPLERRARAIWQRYTLDFL